MWYEILPSFGIIVAAMSVPSTFAYFFNRAVLGNSYRRDLTNPGERRMYLRDLRITGDAYVVSGLEAIPDED